MQSKTRRMSACQSVLHFPTDPLSRPDRFVLVGNGGDPSVEKGMHLKYIDIKKNNKSTKVCI